MVCNGYRPHIGGVETHVGHLVDALTGLGVQVEVLTQETDRRLPAVDRSGAVVVRRFRSVVPSQRDAQAPGLWAWIRRRSADYDVVHFHSYHALVSGAAILARAPIVFTPHYHGTGHSPARVALHRVYRPFGRGLMARADAIICVSEAEAAVVRADFDDAVAGKVQVIPNGVDVAAMRAAEPAAMTEPYFLSLGRLEPYKRVDRVIEALAHVPAPSRLVVLGSGPARRALAELADDCGVGHRVTFIENVERGEVVRWLAGARAVVSMSEHEAFGLTLVEGLAAGQRVVASDLPAHREVARFGPADAVQLLPGSADVVQLAVALEECLASTRDLDRGARVPSWDDVGLRTLAAYREVTGGRLAANRSRSSTWIR